MLAKLLCKLGLHDVVITHPYGAWNGISSPMGYCIRCNKPYQWDV